MKQYDHFIFQIISTAVINCKNPLPLNSENSTGTYQKVCAMKFLLISGWN